VIRGLELTCLGKTASFEVEYVGGRYVRAGTSREVDDLVDLTCQWCGTRFYTREGDTIEFCVHCGRFDRRVFKSFQDLQQWSREQSWGFLGVAPGLKVFGVLKDTTWNLRLARSQEELEFTNNWADVKPLAIDR